MAYKIIFSYKDGGEIKVSNSHKKLTVVLAKKYQNMYSKPSNDGGMVYIPPYRTCTPVPLNVWINNN